MRATVQELFHPVRIEPHHEIVAPRDGGNASPSGEGAPLAQQIDVFGDVQFVELATVFLEPILGRLAVGSRRGGVHADCFHNLLLLCSNW